MLLCIQRLEWKNPQPAYLDLLSSGLQVGERHAGDPRHLHVVDYAHELLEKAQRQERVLQAIHGQPTARLRVAVLQVRDDRMVHVLFLLLQRKS